MTGPGAIASSPSEIAQITASAVQQLSLDPQGLGLSWNLRIATVVNAVPLYARFDGDATNPGLAMTSMVGPVGVEQRVYVLIVPPAGNFVVGFANSQFQSPFATLYSDVGTTASSAGSETAVTWTQQPSVQFGPGRIFRFILKTGIAQDTTTASISFIRIRQGIGTSGTLLEEFRSDSNNFAGQVLSRNFIGFFKNATASTILDTLEVTNTFAVGGTASNLYGGSAGQYPLILTVETYGLIADHQDLADISVSLT